MVSLNLEKKSISKGFELIQKDNVILLNPPTNVRSNSMQLASKRSSKT